MLNRVWAGMIILSVLYSFASDMLDEVNNHYKNGEIYDFRYTESSLESLSTIKIKEAVVHFASNSLNHNQIEIPVSNALPLHWREVAENQSSKSKKELRLTIQSIDTNNKKIQVSLPEIHWVKIRSITNAAFEMAEFAVKLAIGLAGIMALWLGLMRVAEKSGLITYFVRIIYPMLHYLFPKIPKDHPAMGSISLNMAANILGLGNAATPMGIKAMQQLQELNKKKDTASDEMCMFLAINTSSVQLLPPVTLIAVLGAGVSELILPIILATTASTIAAITSAKLLAKTRKT